MLPSSNSTNVYYNGCGVSWRFDVFFIWVWTSGEYHKEIQTLDYDYHIYEEDESRQSELVNQEAGELDMSGTTLEPIIVMTTQKLKKW